MMTAEKANKFAASHGSTPSGFFRKIFNLVSIATYIGSHKYRLEITKAFRMQESHKK